MNTIKQKIKDTNVALKFLGLHLKYTDILMSYETLLIYAKWYNRWWYKLWSKYYYSKLTKIETKIEKMYEKEKTRNQY